ncbi:SCO4225 family membrane protein [Streptomyces sp. NPDC056500]|uniref:SCO4225 family membrane protein n=1 Tax=Streptomyces sp. NPDC056500 TaxID=3345840 RepID=UPI003687EF87
MPNDSRPRRLPRLRRLLALATDNWPARGYLALVAAALGFFLYAAYIAQDAGFAGIWPLMVTVPVGFLVFLVPSPEWDSPLAWLTPLIFSAGFVLSGLVNAAVIGLLTRLVRPGQPRPVG